MPSFTTFLSFASVFTSALADETVYAAYIFHRHGDRTPKALPPANLTTLGYDQVFSAGTYYHNRYISTSSPLHIAGISSGIVKNSQIAVSAPLDTVLLSSAQGFLQGLYPPVGQQTDTLANGTTVTAPLNGYQLIPIALVSAGTASEDTGWLQDASGCANAQISSNNYFSSAEYQKLLNSTKDFYSRIAPVVNLTFPASYVTYKNAYSIFDLINVARIHNSSIPSGNVLDNSTVMELQLLANEHEYGLAYNASDNARAMVGMQLAGEILTFLNGSVTGKGKQKLGIQFGAYASFLSFFGLADLPAASPNFEGIPDYASSMVFEVFGNSTNSSSFPNATELSVRFMYSNGSTGVLGDPTPYPLFGGSSSVLSWNDFSSKVATFEVSTTEKWCNLCGNTTGTCAPFSTSGSGSGNGSGGSSNQGKHMSNAVAGVIGAMVTLAVILGLEALVALVAGLRVVRKGSTPAANGATYPKA